MPGSVKIGTGGEGSRRPCGKARILQGEGREERGRQREAEALPLRTPPAERTRSRSGDMEELGRVKEGLSSRQGAYHGAVLHQRG